MLWFFSTLITMLAITYVLWIVLKQLIGGTINFIDDLQDLTEETLQAELEIIANNIPPLAKTLWGLNVGTSKILDKLVNMVRPRLIQIRNQLLDILLVVIIVGILLFLLSIAIHFKILTIFLAVLFLIAGFLTLEIYAPILDVVTHKRFRRSTRPIALINAYLFNLLIVCAYWYFVDYDTFIVALTTLSLWMLLLIGFGFAGHYFLEKRDGGWFASESNAAGKALRFSAIMLILILGLIKFSETTPGSAIAGTINSVSKNALKKVNVFQEKISGLPGYTTKKTKLYILIGQPGKKKLVPLLSIPANSPLTFPDSLATTLTGSFKGKKIKLVKAVVNGESGFVPKKHIQIGYITQLPNVSLRRTPNKINQSNKQPTSNIVKKTKQLTSKNITPLFLTRPIKIEWDKKGPLITPFAIKKGGEFVIKTLSGNPFLIKLAKNGKEEWHKRKSGHYFKCINYNDIVIIKKTIPGKETFVFIPIS